jgi:hypothetical protein
MARSSPVGVGEQEGGEEGVEDIVRKTLMVVVRKQEAFCILYLCWPEIFKLWGFSIPW